MTLHHCLCYRVCFLGDHLLSSKAITEGGTLMCTKNSSGPLYRLRCSNDTGCDAYFEAHDVELRSGVPGISARLFAGICFTLAEFTYPVLI